MTENDTSSLNDHPSTFANEPIEESNFFEMDLSNFGEGNDIFDIQTNDFSVILTNDELMIPENLSDNDSMFSTFDFQQTPDIDITSNTDFASNEIPTVTINNINPIHNTKSREKINLTQQGQRLKNEIGLLLTNNHKKTIDKRIVIKIHNIACQYNEDLKPCSRDQHRSFNKFYNEHASEHDEIMKTYRRLK